jgi:serine/threonine protein kinase
LEEITETIFMDRKTLLGEGFNTKVRRGYDTSQQFAVAIKHVSFPNAALEEKIFRECEILKNLNDFKHPNILKYYGYEKKENEFFIFLELCSKDTLKEKILSGMSEELIA